MNKTVGFIGAGNMAEVIIKGLIDSGTVSAGRIHASDKYPARLLHIAETYKIEIHNKNFEVVKNSDIVFLSVKPNDIESCVKALAADFSRSDETVVISIAAGITTEKILLWLREADAKDLPPVVRAMPNTPALVGEGMVALAPGETAGPDDVALAEALFKTVGSVVSFTDETHMNAVTGLSGSGPAYVFLFMEAMTEAGVRLGMDKETSKELALQTTIGAARLAKESEFDLSKLREMVTSPGGTTMEGLKTLEKGGFYDIVIGAVNAAAKRAGELAAG